LSEQIQILPEFCQTLFTFSDCNSSQLQNTINKIEQKFFKYKITKSPFIMDDTDSLLDDFFNLGPPKRKYEEPKPSIQPQPKKSKVEGIIDHKRDHLGTEYAERHSAKEQNRLATQSLNMPSTSAQAHEDEDQETRVKQEEDPELPEELSVFQRYQFDLPPQTLPILKQRELILKEISENMVTVLTASTGTGKSSQVPQYILEEARRKKENCNIIVTQPRRIAGEFRFVLPKN
jgi:ATP-dependent RNA helicase TDRD9